MSLPPQTIQIKRKRGEGDEDQAPSYLRVEEKRRQSGNFIYQRRDLADQAKDAARPRRDLRPVIHSSRPGDELIPLDQVKAAAKATQDASPGKEEAIGASEVPKSPTSTTVAIEPRRFHMSRNPIAPRPASSSGISKKSRHSTPAIFVERSRKRKVADAALRELAKDSAGNGMDVDAPQQRLPKRPGADRKQNQPPVAQKTGEKPKPSLPPSLLHRWTVDEEQFVREMEEFTLQEIGQNIARINEQAKAGTPAPSQAPTSPQGVKFKPKAPTKRYAERHPEVAAAGDEQAPKDVEMDAEDSDLDEDDYVIETYVRVPAATLGDTVPPETIGLLVFGTDQDVEFFYGNEEDSDDEWQEDEEDENAEDYYTADYPDDEVASDDEYGRDPYHYRTGNASDLEEFGEDDAYLIDDQDEPSQFKQYVGRRAPQHRSEDEDMMAL